MRLQIDGAHLPGRRCGPMELGEVYENVHVGVGRWEDAAELVPGDAPSARWEADVAATSADDGSYDFRGPLVQGRRGDRFVYLNWGTLADDGTFAMFRRAKLILSEVPPPLVAQALGEHATLACTVDLTDEIGQPRCARVRPPAIAWSVLAR